MKNTYVYVKEFDIVSIELKHKGKVYGVTIDADDFEKVNSLPGTWCIFESKGTQYARMSYHDENGKRQQPLLHKFIGGKDTKIISSNGLDCRRCNLIDTDRSQEPITGQQKIEPDGTIIEITDDKGRTEKLTAVDVKIELVDNFTPAVKKLNEVAKKPLQPTPYQRQRDLFIEHTPLKELYKEPEKPVRGVSWHKLKEKWEASAYWEGKRYRLGYYEEYELDLANAAVTEFREKGPGALDSIKQKYGRKRRK